MRTRTACFLGTLILKKHLILATFKYLVVRFSHEKIKNPVWCTKCILLTRHRNFCHESFHIFMTHVSVLKGVEQILHNPFSFYHSYFALLFEKTFTFNYSWKHVEVTQLAWMHIRCIFEVPHTTYQRYLKEGWFANLWDVSRRLIKDVSSERSLRFLKFSLGRSWVASETVILGPHTKSLFI